MADIRWPGIRSLVLANKETSIRISQPGLPAARWRRRANGCLPFQPRIADEPEHMPSAQRAGIPSPVWGRRVHERSVIKQPRFGALNALRQGGSFEREASIPVVKAKVCARPVGCANSPGVCNIVMLLGLAGQTATDRESVAILRILLLFRMTTSPGWQSRSTPSSMCESACAAASLAAGEESSKQRDLLRHMSTMNRSVIWA